MVDFEKQTFEKIMDRKLERIEDDIDKREGSVIYNTLAATAAEQAAMYAMFSSELDRAFPDTATDLDLTNKAKERGIFRLPATPATRKGVFTGADGKSLEVKTGTRFSGGDCNYKVTGKMEKGVFLMECEQPGNIGNEYFGALVPVEYVQGLSAALLADILIPGEEEEDDETLRARYMASLKSDAFGGNVADYREKIEKIPGVGAVKVFPVWNGGGTVKLVLEDSEYGAPTQALVDTVQQDVDPATGHGNGQGIAPIGHKVTVSAATEKRINITCRIATEQTIQINDIREEIIKALLEYMLELRKNWAKNGCVVRRSQVENCILNTRGVVDVTGTTLCGVEENFIPRAEELPILGEAVFNAN